MKNNLRFLIIALVTYSLLCAGYLTAQTPDYHPQVIAGVDYFCERVDEQLPLVEDLIICPKNGGFIQGENGLC